MVRGLQLNKETLSSDNKTSSNVLLKKILHKIPEFKMMNLCVGVCMCVCVCMYVCVGI